MVNPIPTVVVALLAILVVALLIILVVIVGVHGAGRSKAPELADVMARTARQLNGEAAPPRGVQMLFDEMDKVSAADLSPRQLSAHLKSSIASARSAVSARSAMSAQSPSAPAEVPAVPSHPTPNPAPFVDEDVEADSTSLEDPYGLMEAAAPLHEEGSDAAASTDGSDAVVRVDLPHAQARR